MKKFVFLAVALSISAFAISAPAIAGGSSVIAISQQQPPPLSEEATAAYGAYYAEKDQAKRYALAKAFLEKFASVDEYWLKGPKRFVTNYELTQVYTKCQEADKAFFGGPNEANLNGFLAACDAWVAKAPTPDFFYTNRMALGTGFGVLAGFYKDTDRGMRYAEKALPLLAPVQPPKDWQPKDWETLRKESIGRLTQYQGLFKLRQSAPDTAAAADFLTKAAAIKDGPAYKDPNTYLLRAEAVTGEYTKLNAEYNALSDDDKRGDKGKGVLEKINPVVSRLANDYARVVALTEGKPEFKASYDDAKTQASDFYKFLKNGKTEGIDALFGHFKLDPGVPDLEIKAEESATPKTTPPVGTPADKAAPGKKPVVKKPAQ